MRRVAFSAQMHLASSLRRRLVSSSREAASKNIGGGMSDAQRRSYEYYQRKRMESPIYRFRLWWNKNKKKQANTSSSSTHDLNVQLAWYAAAIVIGALGATYASVPLYKVFCQTTGFGGTTQRVLTDEREPPTWLETKLKTLVQQLPQGVVRKARVHTWTDEDAAARLSTLRPVANAELITVHFDTTVGDVLPWSFKAIQPNVKIVPGETALSFFRVTNHSNNAITGVATYNVHPPKMGLYFQKIQCFCFEEQRILPGETVDMPVFYFIDPQVSIMTIGYARSMISLVNLV
jgi:cytochrome c oxidase assembly protein subunit 11